MRDDYVVSRFVEAINAHDSERIAARTSLDHEFVDSLGGSVRGREAVRVAWQGYFAFCPDYWIRPDEVISCGACVVVFGEAGGTIIEAGRLHAANAWRIPAAWRAVVKHDLVALWCDLRVMAEDAVFGIYCRRFGVPLVDLGTVRLPRLIGHSRAMDLILTGRSVDAREALAIGLANRIAPPGQALAHALALANQIAAFPQACMRNDRLSALEQWDLSESDAIDNEIRRALETLRSGEALSGTQRFADGDGRGGKIE